MMISEDFTFLLSEFLCDLRPPITNHIPYDNHHHLPYANYNLPHWHPLPSKSYAVECKIIVFISLSHVRSSVAVSSFLRNLVLPTSKFRPISCHSCNSAEYLSSRLSVRINSRIVLVRSESPLGFRLIPSLNRPGLGDVLSE